METWIIAILAWIGAYLLGVITNLTSPAVKAILDNSFLSSRKKRIATLLKEYKEIKFLRENSVDLGITVAHKQNKILFLLFVFIAWSGMGTIVFVMLDKLESLTPLFLAAIFMLGSSGLVFLEITSFRRFLTNLRFFNSYKRNIMNQISKLGGNPEDLEKE